jgi:hypothetical protein
LPALACSFVNTTSVVKSRWTLTDIPLLQKGKRVPVRPIDIIVKHICVALVVDVWTRKELYRGANDASDEEDKQDKGEQHHGSGEELALCDVDNLNDDENQGERADCDAVGHDPGRTLACASRTAAPWSE